MAKKKRSRGKRNDKLVDRWSLIHLATGIILGWIMNPLIAFLIMAAYEPVEIFIMSPLLWKKGIWFGYETWRNSLSDIIFDIIGLLIGALALAHLAAAPISLF